MTDTEILNADPLGSGRAYAGEMATPELLAEYEQSKEMAGFISGSGVAWGIDISYYNGDAKKLITDAVANGCSFVIAKASDGVQLVNGSTSSEKNYIDPQFYNTVQYCYDAKVPVIGYHFFRYDNNYFQAPDPNSPSADMQWRTFRRWMGLPLNETKAPRAIYSGVTDLEGYKLDDTTMSYQEDGPVVIAERLQIWMEWMKNNVNLTVDPYFVHELLYTSPGFVNSYCPHVITQIDGGSITGGYLLWLATWLFVKKVITSWNQVSALLPATSWPALGNWGEKIKFWQFGTVSIGGTEVDLNVYKGTKEELYTWLNFTAVTPPPPPVTTTYTVSGNCGIAGASVVLGTQTVTSDATGNYSFTAVPSATNGVIVPSLTGYTFNPVNIAISNLASNLVNQNFVATKNVSYV